MAPPRFVWMDSHGTGRNRFALFRRDFELDRLPEQAWLHLFADTRYRLRVNGAIVAYGPIRFFPKAPEYDSVDLQPYLRTGRNVVTVEVNAFGASSFESLPSIGGFLAWGEVGPHDLDTPGEWRVRALDAYDPWATPWSFAQGPTESVDLRLLPESWHLEGDDSPGWTEAVRILREDNWGPMEPRSIPPYHHRLLEALDVQVAGIREDESVVGFRVESFCEKRNGRAPRIPFAVCLWSPRAQEVELGLFWGPNWLNGQLLKTLDDPHRPGRQYAKVSLPEGWSLLYGEPEGLLEAWTYLVGVPVESGVQLRARPDLDCPNGIRYADPVWRAPIDPAPSRFEDLPVVPEGWRLVPLEWPVPAQARLAAWTRPHGPWTASPDLRRLPDGKVFVADFGREFIGHVRLEVDGEPGTAYDVTVDEHLRNDGMSPVFRHVFTHACDRYIGSGGDQVIEAFRTRGGRYVQVIVRGEGRVRAISVRQTLAHPNRDGSFRCSDPLLTWAWDTGAHTIEASSEDAYVDPWRERGLYVGDALVEHQANRSLTADPSLDRRCLELFAQSQNPDGVVLGCAPAWLDNPHLDYSFLWVVWLRDYVQWTQDHLYAGTHAETVQRILAAPHVQRARSGLLIADGHHVFGDWAIAPEGRLGESLVLNAFYLLALEAAEQMSPGCYAEAVERHRSALETLWDDGNARYAATRIRGELWDGSAIHGNVLACLARLGSEGRQDKTLSYVRDRVARCHEPNSDRIEPYFLYFALQALYDRGLSADAEEAMRRVYGVMHDAGAWAFWETLSRGHGTQSFCHGWSASPTVYLSQRVLGVRREWSGAYVVAPESDTLDWAAGSFPIPEGRIHVEWRVEGDSLRLDVEGPTGVSIRVEPVGRLGRLEVRHGRAS